MANLGYIQVTRQCNQECRFCSNPPTKNTLGYAEGIKEVQHFMRDGYEGVIFTGGEPTLSEDLPKFIQYCTKNGMTCRVITNGQKIADMDYLKKLIAAGLKHLHVSLYSVKPDVQAFLTQKKDSLKNILKALENIKNIGAISVDVNTVICKYNAGHLSENVKYLVLEFPFIKHFVWNNLDPLMNRAAENPDTIPRLVHFEVELKKAVQILIEKGKTFRVERVPLCYMEGFEYASTETRKIIKNEERAVFFLDEKGLICQKTFTYGKAACCNVCTLNGICAGLYEMDKYYSSSELYPVFRSTEKIRKMVLNHTNPFIQTKGEA